MHRGQVAKFIMHYGIIYGARWRKKVKDKKLFEIWFPDWSRRVPPPGPIAFSTPFRSAQTRFGLSKSKMNKNSIRRKCSKLCKKIAFSFLVRFFVLWQASDIELLECSTQKTPPPPSRATNQRASSNSTARRCPNQTVPQFQGAERCSNDSSK